MISNLKAGAPDALHSFTPLFGFSQNVIPQWLSDQTPGLEVDFLFLDGGNNPREQIVEFRLIEEYIPVGGQVMAHDARMRKGKWLVPYLGLLDNWETRVHDFSEQGLLHARKTKSRPSTGSARAARRCLRRAQLQPAELAAWLLPAPFRRLGLSLLPRRLSRRLSDGR